ncbi:hypothetical protein HRH25_14730 [Flavisolibacter sp. BT320]|nr:hypothetical protein [Flavisolibacter longurius]
MRFLLATLLTAAFSFIAGLFLPWWSLAIIAFLVALLIRQKTGFAFLSAFTALFFLWGGLALLIHIQNDGVLAKKMAELFPLQGQSFYLILLTATVGALVAGFAAMSGSSLAPIINRRRER